MSQRMVLFLIVIAASAQAKEVQEPGPLAEVPCSDAWYRSIEARVVTGDGLGHGPDIGSDEWKSVVEFKLGIRGERDLPGRDGEAWCRHIGQIVLPGPASLQGEDSAGDAAVARGPSYDCNKTEAGSIQALICNDAKLSALDRKLAGVYSAASEKAGNGYPPGLGAEQRGWIKGRDDCWKSDNTRSCVREEYIRRITELQARYRLVADNGPVRFVCDGDPASVVVATFFATDPPTLIAGRGDSASLMYLQPGGSGTRYQGRNETFWEHQGEALITWGFGAREMRCRKVPEYSDPE
jgi:uncharacterized protein